MLARIVGIVVARIGERVRDARLVLVGGDGRRLHEEVITAGGRVRSGKYARWNIGETNDALDAAGYEPAGAAAEAHIAALWPRVADSVFAALEARSKERVESLVKKLDDAEAADRLWRDACGELLGL